MQLAGPDMLIDAYDQNTHDDSEVVDIQPDEDVDGNDTAVRADDCECSVLNQNHRTADY